MAAALSMVWAAQALPISGQATWEARLYAGDLAGATDNLPVGLSPDEIKVSQASAQKVDMDIGSAACDDLEFLGAGCQDDADDAIAAELGNNSELADSFHALLSDLSPMDASGDLGPRTQAIDWVSTEVSDLQSPQVNDFSSYSGGPSGSWSSDTGGRRYDNGAMNAALNVPAVRRDDFLPAWVLKWQTWLVAALVLAGVRALVGSGRSGAYR